MTKRIDFSPSTKREISAWSNNRCMICNASVSRKGMPSIAHIIPAAKNGPRSEYFGKDEYTSDFVKSNRNGLLLCPTHHIEVDNDIDGKYPIEYLFDLNNMFRERHNLENTVNIELFTGEKIEDTNKAVTNLLDYLEMTEDEISKEVKKKYEEDIETKIDLNRKIQINKFSNNTSQNISTFVEYRGPWYYSALTHTSTEIGNLYLSTAIKALYLKLDYIADEQKKYDEMLTILKRCCNGLEIDETGILNYFFYICEVFKK